MKESNILADNVAKSLLIRMFLQNTKKPFMKESNVLVNYVAKNLPVRVIL